MLTVPIYLDPDGDLQFRRRQGFVQIQSTKGVGGPASAYAYRIVEPANLASDGVDHIGVLQNVDCRKPYAELLAAALADWQEKRSSSLLSDAMATWIRSWPIEDETACAGDWIRSLSPERFKEELREIGV